jgi:hypothetical protein
MGYLTMGELTLVPYTKEYEEFLHYFNKLLTIRKQLEVFNGKLVTELGADLSITITQIHGKLDWAESQLRILFNQPSITPGVSINSMMNGGYVYAPYVPMTISKPFEVVEKKSWITTTLERFKAGLKIWQNYFTDSTLTDKPSTK